MWWVVTKADVGRGFVLRLRSGSVAALPPPHPLLSVTCENIACCRRARPICALGGASHCQGGQVLEEPLTRARAQQVEVEQQMRMLGSEHVRHACNADDASGGRVALPKEVDVEHSLDPRGPCRLPIGECSIYFGCEGQGRAVIELDAAGARVLEISHDCMDGCSVLLEGRENDASLSSRR